MQHANRKNSKTYYYVNGPAKNNITSIIISSN